MGTTAKVMHGARAQLYIDGKVVGVFSDCSWGLRYDAQPVYILGRFSPAEIGYTAQEAVQVTARGFRILDNGPHVTAKVPKLQDLLRHQDISLSIHDRQSGTLIATVTGCRPVGYETSVSSRALQEMSVTFMGLMVSDESTNDMAENLDASNLP
jgi:hypothetical protein